MKNLKIESMVLGAVQTNCYFLMNSETKELLIIDPADEFGRIESQIARMDAKPAAVLLTHGHFDHMMAADEVRRHWGVKVYAHELEQEVLGDPARNLSGMWASGYTMRADETVKDGDVLSLAGFEIRVMHTPGHTQGSVCYYFPEEKVLISGDTLFAQSVGRTDFPTSDGRKMRESIRRLLETLPADTDVYPGHMGETTIGYEKRYNPFA